MSTSLRSKLTTVAAIGAASVGGAAIANAASSHSSGTQAKPPGAPSGAQMGRPPGPHNPALGGHRLNGRTEKLLTGTTAAKVRAAASAKVPGGTIERVETNVDTSAPYEAHVRKDDGSEVIVYVDSSFNVTGTGSMQHP